MIGPAPAHEFGLLAARLALALDAAIDVAHSSLNHRGRLADCQVQSCVEAIKLIGSAENAACRAVVAPGFADQLAGYADGIATCVLRHEK